MTEWLNWTDTVLHNGCINLYAYQQCKRVPFPRHHLSHLLFEDFLMMTILTSVRWYLIVILICISVIMNGIGHLFMCLLTICFSSFENCLFRSSTHFWGLPLWPIVLLDFFLLSCINCLYVLKINPLSFASFGNIFSYPEGCLLFLFMVYFAVQELLHLKGSIFFKSWGKLCLSVISVISAPVFAGLAWLS